jgi:amino acid transporter
MSWKQLFATKSLETLQAEVTGEHRLRRALGPISLTASGVGAVIGAGIFVMTGQVAAENAGPAVVLSFVVAGVGCLFAALCYAEFAALAPVAGSAYTYAYATLGEMFAWLIGWNLVLEYAMACACVASSWSKYLNELLRTVFGTELPSFLCNDPFSRPGAWFNLPALLITLAVTYILVRGIRESATTNSILVAVKLGVVLFVIFAGLSFINPKNWFDIPVTERQMPEEELIPELVKKAAGAGPKRMEQLRQQSLAAFKIDHRRRIAEQLDSRGASEAEKQEAKSLIAQAEERYSRDLPQTDTDKAQVRHILDQARQEAPARSTDRWGLLGTFGIDRWLTPIDDAVRNPFAPYGLAGVIFGAAMVFFAYIGFDAVSTQAEEALRPQRDVPIAILASLVICTILYIGVAAVITGMVPYPEIDTEAAVAAAFRQRGELVQAPLLKGLLRGASGLISVGAIAGMTSVLLITFLGQVRIFLAMARDGLLPPNIFAAVHPHFKTPHRSTLLIGIIISLTAAFTPIKMLEKMVNIGTLSAFVIVCAAVMVLRVQRPHVERPFRTPLLFVFGPLGIVVNLVMMLFLPPETWIRLAVWLAAGMAIYFGYGWRHSHIGRRQKGLIPSLASGSADGLADKRPLPPASQAIPRSHDSSHEKK